VVEDQHYTLVEVLLPEAEAHCADL
jgi:hypothetical protein